MALLLVATLAASAAAAEIHPGNIAAAATLLERNARSTRTTRSVAKHHRAISADGDDFKVRQPSFTMELDDMKSEYLGKVGIGTAPGGGPLFQARVVFDTGSTNLWVASSLCEGDACNSAGKQTSLFYDPGKSMTAKLNQSSLAEDIDITFGTGELRGPLAVDTYRIGDMAVKDQPFAMIREMSGSVFSSIPFEGIVGLAFPSLSFGGIQPFFDRVIDQKVLPSNEFSFYLNEDSQKPSAIMWGGVDPGLYTGPIKLFPVIQPHYWSLELVDFKLGNKSFREVEGHPPVSKLIVDSGTTYYSGPGWFLEKILEQTPSADCDATESYPNMEFVLKDAQGELHSLSVSPDGYMLEGEQKDCTPGWMSIEVRGEYGPAIILGEVFLRRFYTVFRRGSGKVEEARVGFARAKSGAMPQVHHEKPLVDAVADGAGTTKVSSLKDLFDLAGMKDTANTALKDLFNLALSDDLEGKGSSNLSAIREAFDLPGANLSEGTGANFSLVINATEMSPTKMAAIRDALYLVGINTTKTAAINKTLGHLLKSGAAGVDKTKLAAIRNAFSLAGDNATKTAAIRDTLDIISAQEKGGTQLGEDVISDTIANKTANDKKGHVGENATHAKVTLKALLDNNATGVSTSKVAVIRDAFNLSYVRRSK